MAALTHLDLSIDLDTEPIAGSLAVAGGEATKFNGYTGLIAALEALRQGESERPDTEREEQE